MTPPFTSSEQLDLQDLSYEHGLRDPHWLYMRRFLAELQEEFEKKSQYVMLIAAHWETAFKMLRVYEQTVLLGDKATEFEKEYYRGCVAIVKGHGILLLALLKKNDQYSIKDTLGFSEDDLASAVSELEMIEGTIYRSLTPVRKEELKALFGGNC